MAASLARNESKITLEIRTKSVEQTLVPLVTQVGLFYVWLQCASTGKYSSNGHNTLRVGGAKCSHTIYDSDLRIRVVPLRRTERSLLQNMQNQK